MSSGAFIQGYGSAVVLACGPGLHQKRLEHCKACSRSEIVAVLRLSLFYVVFSAAIPTCCIRSLSPISRCCFGAASATSDRLLTSTRNFQGTRLRRCSRFCLIPTQLPKNLPLKKHGKCTAGSACSSAATNAASCLPPIMAHLPSSAHALPAKWRLTAAKRARLPICPTTKLRALACKKPQKLKMNQDAAVNG